jgi:hypothetical protein
VRLKSVSFLPSVGWIWSGNDKGQSLTLSGL